ncbi:MAG: signal transduction histidine kinase, LytS [Paenibacillaceae bacterium]|nr:signal transduction histidine kinase, LytS [Paenibacillaceae bacterium]
MMRKILVTLVLIVTAIAVYLGIVPPQDKAPTVRNGYLDLSDWDEQKSLKSLDGEWQFYWGRLLEERDFRSEPGLQADRLGWSLTAGWRNG